MHIDGVFESDSAGSEVEWKLHQHVTKDGGGTGNEVIGSGSNGVGIDAHLAAKGEEVFGQAQKVYNRSVVFVKNDRVGDGLAKLGCRRVRKHGSRSAQGVHATLRIDRRHVQVEGDGHSHAVQDRNF